MSSIGFAASSPSKSRNIEDILKSRSWQNGALRNFDGNQEQKYRQSSQIFTPNESLVKMLIKDSNEKGIIRSFEREELVLKP